MFFGRIITRSKRIEANELIDVTSDIASIDPSIPTLIVGKQLAVEMFGADKVKVDLNHPLAGNKLNFKGYVIENREATNDEIQTLLNHMNGGGCSGHCGGCENEGGCKGEGGCGHHDEKHSKEGGCCGHCH